MATIETGYENAKTELHLAHRPQTLEEVVGQPEAVATIKGFGKRIPHVLMMEGPAGVGKTSIARIIARMLGCAPENRMDFEEINCALVESPMAKVQEIQGACTAWPMSAPCRVWILDELQSFSRAGFAMQGLLKVLEDGPAHAYFMLCTTDSAKILPAIRSRCTRIKLKGIPDADMGALLKRVAKERKETVQDALVARIVEGACGCARDALAELGRVLGIVGDAERMKAAQRIGAEAVAFDLVKTLALYGGAPDWDAAARVLEGLKEEEPESLRQMILACARTALLKKGHQNAYKTIRSLDTPYWDRNSGHALLAAGIFVICRGIAK